MAERPGIIDLGCGNKKRAGAVGMDFHDRAEADFVMLQLTDCRSWRCEYRLSDSCQLDDVSYHLRRT